MKNLDNLFTSVMMVAVPLMIVYVCIGYDNAEKQRELEFNNDVVIVIDEVVTQYEMSIETQKLINLSK